MGVRIRMERTKGLGERLLTTAVPGFKKVHQRDTRIQDRAG